MGFYKSLPRLVPLVLAVSLLASTSVADDVVMDEKQGSKDNFSKFVCSKCPRPSKTMLNLLNGGNSGSVTAGELWKFFDSQGVTSLQRLTLQLDIETEGHSGSAVIHSMEFQIEDPSNFGRPLTVVSMHDDDILKIRDYDIASFKPEANLEIKLGYDFMERFSADSTEIISLDVSSEANSRPVISFAGSGGSFSYKNGLALGAFAIFWALVFVVLNRFTKPQVIANEPRNVRPQKHQILST